MQIAILLTSGPVIMKLPKKDLKPLRPLKVLQVLSRSMEAGGSSAGSRAIFGTPAICLQ
jgi:hypothetical protein